LIKIAKRLLYPLYHRVRNRDTLTVAMFHRVLPPTDPRWPTALPDWTVSDTVFEECLRFFKRHYNVVGIDRVLEARRTGRRLPPRSLLITFDDGYSDNEEYAMPLLRAHGLPAVVFVFSDAIERRTRPWSEDLLSAHLRGVVSDDDVRALHAALWPDGPAPDGETADPLHAIAARASELPEEEVARVTERLGVTVPRPSDPPQMLTTAQLRRLQEHGIAVAAHGKTHTALTVASHVECELREPRAVLARALALPAGQTIDCLSCPFGAHDAHVLAAARETGYALVFLMEDEIHRLRGGRLDTPVLSRVNVSGPRIAPEGRLLFEQIAWAFFRARHAPPSQPW
jgi:peptidoglycan/xylan/chitin deacetylase (PgdA/CDA1 family)